MIQEDLSAQIIFQNTKANSTGGVLTLANARPEVVVFIAAIDCGQRWTIIGFERRQKRRYWLLAEIKCFGRDKE